MGDKNNYSEWLKYAELDLNSAVFLLKMIPMPLEIICYHCQQSSEKALKSFHIFKEKELFKTHDLIVLLKECAKEDSSFIQIQEECINLTDFSINTRYPYPLDLNESDARMAIKDAEKVLMFVQNKIYGKAK